MPLGQNRVLSLLASAKIRRQSSSVFVLFTSQEERKDLEWGNRPECCLDQLHWGIDSSLAYVFNLRDSTNSS